MSSMGSLVVARAALMASAVASNTFPPPCSRTTASMYSSQCTTLLTASCAVVGEPSTQHALPMSRAIACESSSAAASAASPERFSSDVCTCAPKWKKSAALVAVHVVAS